MAQAAEEKAPETTTTAERQALKEQSLDARKDCDQARQVQTTYHENLRGVSDAIHPFSLSDRFFRRDSGFVQQPDSNVLVDRHEYRITQIQPLIY